MTTGRKKQQPRGRRRSPRRRPTGVDLWAPVAPLPELPSIRRANDPTALTRSLGNLSLPGQGVAVDHYIAAVIERAAALAGALAAAADILASPIDE